jgi:hypothetical protein
MHSLRTAPKWLRLAFAALFAAMTLVQVPTMALACATGNAHTGNADAANAAAPHASHHGSHTAHAHDTHDHHPALPADTAHDPSGCYAMGCCIAVSPAATHAPAAIDRLLGVLDLMPAQAMLPAHQEPADPPPRLLV